MTDRTGALLLAIAPSPGAAFDPPWARLSGRPVLSWSLTALARSPLISRVALVVSDRLDEARRLAAAVGPVAVLSAGGYRAALAAGLCLGALGTDTGGSVRIPAACTGTIGLKPTFLLLKVARVICFQCEHTRQVKVPFADPRRTYTHAFERYALELSKATTIQDTLRAPQLRQPHAVQTAYAAIVSSQVQLINILNIEIEQLGEVVARAFWPAPGR